MSGSPVRTWSKPWWRQAGRTLAAIVLCYAAFLLLGFIPRNLAYELPPAEDRVRLFIRSNEIHTDLVLPVQQAETGIDWREVFPWADFPRVTAATHVSIGWGDRGFFVHTPRWSDLRLKTVLHALLIPSETVLHVEYLSDPVAGEYLHEFWVTADQYRQLAEYVRSSAGGWDAHGRATLATEVTYGPADRFYHAGGSYHAFNSCNQWTGRGLAEAGVPVGIWTPLKGHVLWWLPTPPRDQDLPNRANRQR